MLGKPLLRNLPMHYGIIEALKRVTFEDLILVDEIGEKIAGSVLQFFKLQKNLTIIERLRIKVFSLN